MAAGVFLVIWGILFSGCGAIFLYFSLTDPSSITGTGNPTVFGSVFIVIGIGAIALGIRMIRSAKQDQSRLDTPDRVVPVEKIIFSNEKRTWIGYWFFSLIWSGFTVVIVYNLWIHPTVAKDPPFWVHLVGGIFVLVAPLLLYQAIITTLDILKFGRVPFSMKACPASVGGIVKGFIDVNVKNTRLNSVKGRLICNRIRWRRGANNKSTRTTSEHWSYEHRHIVTPQSNSRYRIEVEYDIPNDQPATTMPGSFGTSQRITRDKDYYQWELSISADLQGVDLNRTYSIPVQASEF